MTPITARPYRVKTWVRREFADGGVTPLERTVEKSDATIAALRKRINDQDSIIAYETRHRQQAEAALKRVTEERDALLVGHNHD